MSEEVGKSSLTQALKRHGKLDQRIDSARAQTYFDKMLNESLGRYANIGLDSSEMKELNQMLFMMKYGSGVFTPIICKNDECPYNKICPLHKFGKAPTNDHCPLELATITDRAKYWSLVFSDNGYDVSTNMLYEHYITKLTYLDLLLQRCSWSEACGYSDMVLETTTKVSRYGEIEKQVMENPIIAVSDRLLKAQNQILTDLAITPREVYKRKALLRIKDESSDFALQQMKKRNALKEVMKDDENIISVPEHLQGIGDGRE